MELNRRLFLMGSALAAREAAGQAGERVATGMIGIGGRGTYLLKSVLAQPDAKVVALCDIKPDRLDKAATTAARDNPATFTDWRKLLERKDVDAVYIATPPYLHSEMAIAALQAGKHVYCEKPIGVTPAQVRALVAAAKASKRVFVPGQQMRSIKMYQEAIRQIREGVIGEVIMVKAQRHAGSDLPYDGTSGDWYFDVAKSGGYLIEQSVHNLDLCNWAIGALPTRAAGFGAIMVHKNEPPGRTIFDCGSIVYQYPNGAQMSFTQNVFHPRGFPGPSQIVYLTGTKGGIDLVPTPTLYPSARGEKPVPMAQRPEGRDTAHIEAFYSSILKGTPLPADIVIGASAALTAILGHQAMSTGRVVNWSDFKVTL